MVKRLAAGGNMVMSAGTGLGILFVFAMAVVSVVGEPVGSPGVPDGRERC